MERRSLLDHDMTPTRENPNVFDDEYEAEDFDGVADGFRPSDHDREGHDEPEDQPLRTTSTHNESSPVTTAVPSGSTRNSMRKSRPSDNPFASPDDEESTPNMSFEPAAAHRSVSSASSNNFARTESQRFGAGPSHPYGMYTQATMPRSPSIATQSTVRPAQSDLSAHAGPQHPYALYPQGVGEDEQDDALHNAVPVGFTGLGQTYRRQFGPDGEEQDILGADGHAEQLPPYTRYPEDGPEKMPLLVPEAPMALHSRAPVAGTDPTMALMHTPLRPSATPQPQSMTDQSNLNGRPPSLANVERLNSRSAMGSTDSAKSWSEKSWKEKRKTKFCGIPFWWILLSVCVLAFIAIVLGGVIGGLLEHQHDTIATLDTAKTSLYDANAIPTPASMSPPTGTFALSLSTPQYTQAQCLPQANQQAAWSCDLGGPPAEAIVVETPPGSDQLGAYLFYTSDSSEICYGTQPSFMQTAFAPFMAVIDNNSPKSGPAFYFQQFYDKVVVLPASALSPSSKRGKRQNIQLDQSWFQQKQAAQAGQQPWFCVWNNTFVEGFIYPSLPIPASYSLNTSAVVSTTSTSSAVPTPPPANTPPTAMVGSPPTVIITSTVTMPTSTATFTGPAMSYASWAANVNQVQSASNSGNYGSNHPKRQVNYDSLQMYPFVVKLEERRLPGNTVQPYCQQYQILDDGGYNPVADGNGNPIIVQLDEKDPGYNAYQSAGIAGSTTTSRHRRWEVPGTCHCEWMSGQ